MFSALAIPGALQEKKSDVTPQPTLVATCSFLQLVLLLYTSAMLISLVMELSSLSEETPPSSQSLQGLSFLRKLTGVYCTLTHHACNVSVSHTSSGGITLNFTGTELTSVQRPTLVVNDHNASPQVCTQLCSCV